MQAFPGCWSPSPYDDKAGKSLSFIYGKVKIYCMTKWMLERLDQFLCKEALHDGMNITVNFNDNKYLKILSSRLQSYKPYFSSSINK